MDAQKINELAKKYGKWSSWAVWNDSNLADTEIIYRHADKLHTNYIIVGLNASKDLLEMEDWSNFHIKKVGGHDRKLCKAFNGEESKVRGAYMTDLLKIVDKYSKNIREILSKNDNGVEQRLFETELQEVGATERSIFVLIGKDVQKHFHSFTNGKYKLKIELTHYSARGKDNDWVATALEKVQTFNRQNKF